jgi:hypothetical protein
VNVKTRKRNIVVPEDPGSFANAVVALIQDASEGTDREGGFNLEVSGSLLLGFYLIVSGRAAQHFSDTFNFRPILRPGLRPWTTQSLTFHAMAMFYSRFGLLGPVLELAPTSTRKKTLPLSWPQQ